MISSKDRAANSVTSGNSVLDIVGFFCLFFVFSHHEQQRYNIPGLYRVLSKGIIDLTVIHNSITQKQKLFLATVISSQT